MALSCDEIATHVSAGPNVGMNNPRKPFDFKRFDEIIQPLERWRCADNEDAIKLTRNQVIDLIEGVRALGYSV